MGLIRTKLLGIESRRKNRTPICVLVEEPGRNQEYFDKSIDLSEEGMFVQTETPHQKGEEVTLRFALPGCPVITATGKVARVKDTSKVFSFSSEAPTGMGISFTKRDPESRKILAKFVNS